MSGICQLNIEESGHLGTADKSRAAVPMPEWSMLQLHSRNSTWLIKPWCGDFIRI